MFLMDFYTNADIARSIIGRLTNIRIQQAQYFARMGVDIIRLGDDIVTQNGLMFSKQIYREFFKPQVKRIVTVCQGNKS